MIKKERFNEPFLFCAMMDFELMFIGLLNAVKKRMSLRASSQTGVAIPRIFRELSMEETISFARNHFHF